jgi:hypothetical protein
MTEQLPFPDSPAPVEGRANPRQTPRRTVELRRIDEGLQRHRDGLARHRAGDCPETCGIQTHLTCIDMWLDFRLMEMKQQLDVPPPAAGGVP